MQRLNKSIRTLRGYSDDPMLPGYVQQDLECTPEEENNSSPQEVPQKSGETAPTMPEPTNIAEDIVIDFGQEGASPQDQLAPPDSEPQENQGSPVISEDVHDYDPAYVAAIEHIIKITLYGVLKWNTVSGFILILTIFTINMDLSSLYVLLLISLIDIYSLLSLLHNQPITASEKRKHILQILKNVLSVVAKVSLVFYVYIKPFLLIYSFAPALVYDFLYASFLAIKYKSNGVKGYYYAQFIMKTFTMVFTSCVAMKMDGLINWHWREVFMAFWVCLGFLVGLTLISLFAFLNKLLSFCLPERRTYEMYGLLWVTILFSGISTCSSILMYKLQQMLDDGGSQENLTIIFIVTAVYNIGVVLYTSFHFTKIETFFRKLTVTEQEELLALTPEVEEHSSFKQPQTPQKLVIPRFLTKSSNTFFRRVTQTDIDKNKAKQAIKKQAKPKEESAKAKAQLAKQIKRKSSCDSISTRHQQFLANQFGALAPPIEDLGIIPETDRDNFKTEMSMRKPAKRDDRIKPLNLTQRKISELIGMSQGTDRSRAGLLSVSQRSTVNFPSGEYNNTEDTNAGGFTTTRRRNADGEKIDSPRPQYESNIPNGMAQLSQNRVMSEAESIKNNGLFDVEEAPRSRRRGNSMVILPQFSDLPEICESASNKENSRIEASELVTSPTMELSGVQQCLICFDRQPDAVFMDCGHGGVCYECSLEIWKTTTECYLCRKRIVQVLQIDSKYKIGRNIIKVVSATQMVLCGNQQQENAVEG